MPSTCDKDGTQLYMVTDVGSTFGMTGRSYTDAMSKNDLKKYRKAKFITKIKPDYVDLNFPTHAPLLFIFAPNFFLMSDQPLGGQTYSARRCEMDRRITRPALA